MLKERRGEDGGAESDRVGESPEISICSSQIGRCIVSVRRVSFKSLSFKGDSFIIRLHYESELLYNVIRFG